MKGFYFYQFLYQITKIELLDKAIIIAQEAHRRQTDKYNAPYIGHVFRVMNDGKTLDEKIVGVLHDVVEDCPNYDFDYLKKEGFPKYIVDTIRCITKLDDKEPYDDFIKRTEKSLLAVAVKLNDLKDNMDLKRCTRLLTEEDLKRFNKYLKTYLYLTNK